MLKGIEITIIYSKRCVLKLELINNLVSIITPAYNAEKYIKDTIESVIAQTYVNWELIIVDDASKDNTVNIIKIYQKKDRRIKLIPLNENQGVANARNTAIENAQGQYIAFLDADDFWEKEKLSKQIKFMQNNKIAFSYHAYRLFDLSNQKQKTILVPEKLNYKELLKGNTTGSCLTICIDRNVVKNIYFPQKKHEDYICWLNILKQYDIEAYGFNEVLGTYRIGKKSISSNKLRSAYWNWKVYRDSQKLSIIQSLYYMYFYMLNGLRKYL